MPVATHLPFIVSEKDDKIILKSHFAKANPQAVDSIDTRILVIFTEPHAYISPKHYEKVENVPTWNYIAVHAYGRYTLLEGEDKKDALLKETIKYYEADYLKQWDNLPDSFKTNMMKGITAFEIVVDELQAKSKLSQNKTQKEINSIVKELGNSENTNEKDIADYMSQLKKKE
jgi:transcriptional regulator